MTGQDALVDEPPRRLPDQQLLLGKLRIQKHVVHTAKGHTCYGIAGIIPNGIPFESITLLTGKKFPSLKGRWKRPTWPL